MARAHKHTLEIHGKKSYPISLIERRALPELEIHITHEGKTEDGDNVWTGRIDIIGAGSGLLTNDLPKSLQGRLKKETEFVERLKRDGNKETLEWADETVGHFLESGLFSLAVVITADGKKWEYEPQLRIISAKVYKG